MKASAGFYGTQAWRKTAAQAIARAHHRCQACGQRRGRMIVDHIKERATHPELAYEQANLRVLCQACHNKRHAGRDFHAEQGAHLDGTPRGPSHPWNMPTRAGGA